MLLPLLQPTLATFFREFRSLPGCVALILPAGQNYRFYFQGVEMGTGQHWYVPLMVAKGARAGKTIALVAGVHGDELSSIRTVQRVMAELDPSTMTGSVIAVLGLSRAALELTQARWPMAYGGGSSVDINRVWPGDEHGDNPPPPAMPVCCGTGCSSPTLTWR